MGIKTEWGITEDCLMSDFYALEEGQCQTQRARTLQVDGFRKKDPRFGLSGIEIF